MTGSDVAAERRLFLPQGVGVILCSSACFGVMAVCVNLAAREMGAGQIAFFRFLGSFLVMLAITRGAGLQPQPGNLGALVLRGAVGATAIVLYFIGIAGAGAGLATLIQNTYPVFASIFAALLLGERLSSRLGLALLLNLVGVGTVVVGPGLSLESRAVTGALAAAASAVFAGVAVTAVRHLRQSEGASLITTYFMGVAGLITLPTLLAGLPPATPALVGALLGVVFSSIAGQWLLHHGLGYTTAAQGSLAAATNVLAATSLEAAVFGKAVGPTMLIGALFMFAAIVIARTGPTEPATEPSLPDED